MIILTKDPGGESIDAGDGAVCVRHRDVIPPQMRPGCLHLTSDELLTAGARVLAGRRLMVVVGLSRIATPGNRTKVGPLLWGRIDGMHRVSIDRTLFVAEPWRAWWHFGCVGAVYREYTYSYLAESHWKMAGEGLREDPFSLEEICRWGDGTIVSRYDRFFESIEVEVVPMSLEVHAEYKALKIRAFDEEHTAKAIVARLARFAGEACPSRRVPTPAGLFKSDRHCIVRTDLRVDEHLVGVLLGLAAVADGIAGRFHNAG